MTDKEYWKIRLPWPYSPSEEDVQFYQDNKQPGSTLLLGCTHYLIPLSDFQMDIDPWYDGSTVIVQDWRDNSTKYANIIGDGVLNLSKQLADDVIIMASQYSNIFIARSFNHKLQNMKVASNFPCSDDLIIAPTLIQRYEHYSFYVWRFQND